MDGGSLAGCSPWGCRELDMTEQRKNKIQHFFFKLKYTADVGFAGGSAGKGSACNVRDLGLIPGLGISPEEGKGYPLQHPGLENSMDCIGVAKSQTRLTDFHIADLQLCVNFC